MERKQMRLRGHLKSVAILLQAGPTGDDYEPATSQLVDWLARYDRWFKQSVGIADGHRPHVLYNREVALFGADVLAAPSMLKQLAADAIGLGYAVSVTIDMVDLYERFDVVRMLCDESLLSSLGVITDRIDELAAKRSVAAFMQDLVGLRRPIGLIGSVEGLRRHELLSLEALNSTDLTMYGSGGDSAARALVPDNPVKACASRLRLYIDGDGYIYPCLGLLGLVEYAVGHIAADIADTALGGGSYKLNLLELMTDGPSLRSDRHRERMTTLPWVCEQHRAELLG